MNIKLTAILTCFFVLLTSCQTSRVSGPGVLPAVEVPAAAGDEKPAPEAGQSTPDNNRSNRRLARRVNAIIMKNEMLLGPEDLIDIKVKDHPELATSAPVDPWGFIRVPYLRPIQVNGMTEGMVEEVLTQQYADFFRQPPEIEVNVAQYNSQVVYVLGAVERPGRYPLVKGRPMTLRDIVVEAGLPRPEASLWRTWIIRQTTTGQPEMWHVNLHRILFRGELANNSELRAGDIVYLPMGILDAIVAFVGRIFSPITGVARRAYVSPT